MTKINSQFAFNETLDLDAVLPAETNMSQSAQPYSQRQQRRGAAKNLYHLHSILIHRGTLGAGHYFAFIRPSLEDQWYEFNDRDVTPIIKSTALCTGGGGSDSTFELRDGVLYEKAKINQTSAYMLVYIRDCDR